MSGTPPIPVADVFLTNTDSDVFYVSRDQKNNVGALVQDQVVIGYAKTFSGSNNTKVFPVEDYHSIASFVNYQSVAIREITGYEIQKSFYSNVSDNLLPFLFDTSNSTSWNVDVSENSTAHVVYDFQQPIDWTAYSLIGNRISPDSHPKSWKVYASNDEVSWTLVDERNADDVGFSNSSQEILFKLIDKVNSRYFRIDFSEPNNPMTELSLSGLKIFDIPLTEKSLISLINVISEPEFQGSSFKKILDSCVYPLIRHQNHRTYIMKSGFVSGSTQDPYRFGESYKAFNLGSNMYWLSYYDSEPGIYYQYIKPKKRLTQISFEIRTNIFKSVGIPRKLTIQASNSSSGWVDIETYENQTFNLNLPTVIERTPDENEKYYLLWRLKFSDFDRTNEEFDIYDFVKPTPDTTTSVVCTHTVNSNDFLYDKTTSSYDVTKTYPKSPVYTRGIVADRVFWRNTNISINSKLSYETLRKFRITGNIRPSEDFTVNLLNTDGSLTYFTNMTSSDFGKTFYVSDDVNIRGIQIVENKFPDYSNTYQSHYDQISTALQYVSDNKQWTNPYRVDNIGNYIFDDNMEPISRFQRYELDSNGEILLDVFGNPIPRSNWPLYCQDDSGNTINDILGNPIPFTPPWDFWRKDPTTGDYIYDSLGNRSRNPEPISLGVIWDKTTTIRTNNSTTGYIFYKPFIENPTSISQLLEVPPIHIISNFSAELFVLDTRNIEISISTTLRDHRNPSRFLFSYDVTSVPNKPFPKSWKVYGKRGTTKTLLQEIYNQTFSSGETKTYYITDDDKNVLSHINPIDHFSEYVFEIEESEDIFDYAVSLQEISLKTYEPLAVNNSRVCLSDLNLWTLDKCSMFCDDEDVYVTKYPIDLHKEGNEISYFTDITGDVLPVGKVTSPTTSLLGYEAVRMYDPFENIEWRTNSTTAEMIYEFYEYGFTDPSDQFVKIKAESIIHGIELIASKGDDDSTKNSLSSPKEFEVYTEKLDGSGWDLVYSKILQGEEIMKNNQIRQFWFKEIGKFGVTKKVKFIVKSTQGENLKLNSVKFFTSFPCMYRPLPSDLPLSCDTYYSTVAEKFVITSPYWECYEILGDLANLHISGSLTTAKQSQLIYNPTTDNQYSSYKMSNVSDDYIDFYFRKSSTNNSLSDDFTFAIDIVGPKQQYSGTRFNYSGTEYEKYEHFTPKSINLYGRNDNTSTWDLVETLTNIPVVNVGETLRVKEIDPKTDGYQYQEYRIEVQEFHGDQEYPFSGYMEDQFLEDSLVPNMTSAVLNATGTEATLGVVKATSSSVFGIDRSPKQLFDKSNTTNPYSSASGSFVNSIGNEVIEIDLANTATGEIAEFYSIRSSTVENYFPVDWKFYGWNSTDTWVLLDTQSNQAFGSGELKEYSFSNSVEYTKFKLEITKNFGGSFVSIRELNIYRKIVTPVLIRTWPINEAKVALIGIRPCPYEGTEIDAHITRPSCSGIRVPSPSKIVDNPLQLANEIYNANMKSMRLTDIVEFNIISNSFYTELEKKGYFVNHSNNYLIEYISKSIEAMLNSSDYSIYRTTLSKVGFKFEVDIEILSNGKVERVVDFDFMWKKRNGLLPEPVRVKIKPFDQRIAWGVQQT